MIKNKVKSLIMEFTDNSPYHLLFMTGPSNIAKRQAILETITGNKEPRSKCGINRVEAEVWKLFDITGDSIGGKMSNLEKILINE